MEPLLSICIPTYNRAELLKLALISLVQQAKGLEDLIEIIVSDNGSSDHTEEVCNSILTKIGRGKYHRNSHNLGCTANILTSILLAKGKFCWIIGDDDMIINGKLSEILSTLRANPSLSYFFVNYFFKPIAKRNILIKDFESRYEPKVDECMCKDFSSRRVDKWEYLLEIENTCPEAMFTAIVSHIFKRELFLSKSELLLTRNTDGYFDVAPTECNFPHVEVLAHAMVGRPAYYIGGPCILLGQGSQEWGGKWPLYVVNDVSKLLRMYRQLEVDNNLVNRLEEMLIARYSDFITELVAQPHADYRSEFSLWKFMWKHRRHFLEITRLKSRINLYWVFLRLPEYVKQYLARLYYYRKGGAIC